MRQHVFASAMLALAMAACGGDGTVTAPKAPAAPTVANAIGVDPVSGATIETNQDDYVPGEVVHVTGRGWSPDETVRLEMSESPDTHPDVAMDVQADASGSFSVHFYDVQPHDWGVTFTLQATGLSSGSRATATFTDGRTVLSVVRSPNPSPPGATVNVTVTVNLDGNIGATTWNGTGWTISNASGIVAGPVCVNTGDHALGDGHADDAHVAAFTLTAPAQDGLYTFTIATHSSDDCSDANSDNLAVALIVTAPTNGPPAVSAGGPYSGAEGSPIAVNGASASDPDGDHLTYAWTYAAGGNVDAGASCSFADASVLSPIVTCTDDGQYTLTLTVSDGQNAPVSASALLDVTNVAPTISAIALSPVSDGNIYPISQPVTITATFSDPGAADAHECTTSAVAIKASPIAFGPAAATDGACANVLAGLPEGVYNVTITVTDKDRASDSETVQVVVYEPVFSGFVTGGGWIDSPAGAYAGDPSASGRASFGFVSRYQKGAPNGSTQFVFHVAGFHFRSATYDLLVVSQGGSAAQFKGTGTVNGVDGYSFMVWATDGAPDGFRIKIWDVAGAPVYDNGSDSQVQGSIVVHVAK